MDDDEKEFVVRRGIRKELLGTENLLQIEIGGVGEAAVLLTELRRAALARY